MHFFHFSVDLVVVGHFGAAVLNVHCVSKEVPFLELSDSLKVGTFLRHNV